MFNYEICLFEIVEIVIINNIQIIILAKQIKLNGYHSHFES